MGGSHTASKPSSPPPVHIPVQLACLAASPHTRPSLCCYWYFIGFMLACRCGLAPGSHRGFGEALAGCLLEGSPTSVSTSSVSTISSSAPHPRVGASKRELQLRDSGWGALHSGQWTLRQACPLQRFGCLEIQIWEQRSVLPSQALKPQRDPLPDQGSRLAREVRWMGLGARRAEHWRAAPHGLPPSHLPFSLACIAPRVKP